MIKRVMDAIFNAAERQRKAYDYKNNSENNRGL